MIPLAFEKSWNASLPDWLKWMQVMIVAIPITKGLVTYQEAILLMHCLVVAITLAMQPLYPVITIRTALVLCDLAQAQEAAALGNIPTQGI